MRGDGRVEAIPLRLLVLRRARLVRPHRELDHLPDLHLSGDDLLGATVRRPGLRLPGRGRRLRARLGPRGDRGGHRPQRARNGVRAGRRRADLRPARVRGGCAGTKRDGPFAARRLAGRLALGRPDRVAGRLLRDRVVGRRAACVGSAVSSSSSSRCTAGWSVTAAWPARTWGWPTRSRLARVPPSSQATAPFPAVAWSPSIARAIAGAPPRPGSRVRSASSKTAAAGATGSTSSVAARDARRRWTSSSTCVRLLTGAIVPSGGAPGPAPGGQRGWPDRARQRPSGVARASVRPAPRRACRAGSRDPRTPPDPARRPRR